MERVKQSAALGKYSVQLGRKVPSIASGEVLGSIVMLCFPNWHHI